MSDYREAVARAISRGITGHTVAPTEGAYEIADAVLGVRDSEMARLNGKLGAALGERFEALEERNAARAELETLLGQRDQWWDFIGRRQAAYSGILRGMARRVGAYRRSRQRERDDAIVLWQRSEERLSALRAACVVLPEDVRDHVASWGPWCCGDTDQIVEMVESWRPTTGSLGNDPLIPDSVRTPAPKDPQTEEENGG